MSSTWSRTLLWFRFFIFFSQETSGTGALNPEPKTSDPKPYTCNFLGAEVAQEASANKTSGTKFLQLKFSLL
jgi:hypothetical protein